MELFGWQISKKIRSNQTEVPKQLPAIVPKDNGDGASIAAASGYFGQYVDIGGSQITNENDLIRKYRWAATQPEVDAAISDIVNQGIASGRNSAPISLDLTNLDQEDSVKQEIQNQFYHVLKLLKFNSLASDIFRAWYIDGRLFYHLMVDPENPGLGIQEVRKVDPTQIRKVKEVETSLDQATNVRTEQIINEYYIIGEFSASTPSSNGVKVDPNAIAYCNSGLLDETGTYTISYLHKALKIINQLRMLEDALVIYRIARAPERRIFYIDVGNLPKGKAEEYVQGIMSRYRNKLVYDVQSGEIRDDRRNMAMLEDFWLPRREGGRSTEIQTLAGGENLGQIDDIVFFQNKLYKSLNVPLSRLTSDTAYNLGRATEINRDEVKFQKFIDTLRKKFSDIIFDILKVQLLLKDVIIEKDWDVIMQDITIDFLEDNYFAELKENEILAERIKMLQSVEGYISKYFSEKWVRNTILRQTDDDITVMNQQIQDEKDSGTEVVTTEPSPEQPVSTEEPPPET